MLRSFAGAFGLLLLAACSPQPAADEPGVPGEDAPVSGEPAPALIATLEADQFRDSVSFTYRVTNVSEQPVELTFSSGQSFDVIVENGGTELWRWSGDRMFTQALRQVAIAPGETLAFDATWIPAPPVSGSVQARAMLSAREHTAEQQIQLEFP